MRLINLRWIVLAILVTEWYSLGYAQTDLPQVSNRPANEEEFGYRPEDGSILHVTPPGFVWLPEAEADSYIVQCSPNADFSSIGYEKSQIKGNVHCPPTAFNSGLWYWRYAFITSGGKQSGWSQVRSFTIAQDATPFPQPTLIDLLGRLPQEHPKLFLRPETVLSFSQSIEKAMPGLLTQFIAHAEDQLKDPVVRDEPAPYPDGHRGVGKENVDLWRANQTIVRNAVDHAANLAFAYQLTGDPRFGEKAREWVMAVVSWPANGTTAYRYNDECAMPILSCISRAYTWAYKAFSGTDRQKIVETMTERGREVYQYLHDDKQHTVMPYESHRNRAWHFLGETAIAFNSEIPEASQWLQYAMDIFYNVYPVWSDEDGGWHEGVAYWNSYIDRIGWWLDILQSAFHIDGFKKPFFRHSGDFPLYVFPPGLEFGGFGDNADTVSPTTLGPLMNFLATRVENPYWRWYAAKVFQPGSVKEITYLDLLRFKNTGLESKEPVDLPQSKVFHGTGIAAFHSNLRESREDIQILFKSSPFGSRSHGFNAQNSFLLWAYGQPLLTWSGHRDWHGSEHHTQWMWETSSNNSITVNGVGQKKHSPLAKGKIADEFLDPRFDYVAGDAVEAYEGRLKRFIRHIFFIKPRLMFVVDDLEAPEASTFEYHLHSYNPFTIKAQYEIETGNDVATAQIGFVTPSNLVITQTEGHIPPSVGFEKKQWNLQAQTPGKVLQTYFLTMIRPYPSHTSFFDINMESARKGHQEMYYCAVENYKVLFFVNFSRETYTYASITTDAVLMIMVSYNNVAMDSILFVTDASLVKMSDETLFESPGRRDHYFVQWKDIQSKEEEKPAGSDK